MHEWNNPKPNDYEVLRRSNIVDIRGGQNPYSSTQERHPTRFVEKVLTLLKKALDLYMGYREPSARDWRNAHKLGSEDRKAILFYQKFFHANRGR